VEGWITHQISAAVSIFTPKLCFSLRTTWNPASRITLKLCFIIQHFFVWGGGGNCLIYNYFTVKGLQKDDGRLR